MDEIHEKKSRRRSLWNVLTAICLVGLVISLAGTGWTLWCSNREEQAFRELVRITAAGEEQKEMESAGGGETQTEEKRFRALRALNGDYVGWLRIDGTKVDYPVMHTPEDEQYYIHRDFYKADSYSGTPFMGAGCDTDSQSIIIYAHNMNNGTMFGELDQYADESYWEAHPVILFDTMDDEGRYEEGRYEVAAAFRTRIYREGEAGFRYYEYVGDLSEEKFKEFTDAFSRLSIYDTGVKVSSEDRFLMLSTCSYHVEDGRFVVVAKKIGE